MPSVSLGNISRPYQRSLPSVSLCPVQQHSPRAVPRVSLGTPPQPSPQAVPSVNLGHFSSPYCESCQTSAPAPFSSPRNDPFHESATASSTRDEQCQASASVNSIAPNASRAIRQSSTFSQLSPRAAPSASFGPHSPALVASCLKHQPRSYPLLSLGAVPRVSPAPFHSPRGVLCQASDRSPSPLPAASRV